MTWKSVHTSQNDFPSAAIHFGGWQGTEPPAQLHLAYRLATDDYRGGEAIQLVVEHLSPA